MRERPILFSAPMVRAILSGAKTQTRRIAKGARELSRALDWPLSTCPYGQPGDRLWVKETWNTVGYEWDDYKPTDVSLSAQIVYRADAQGGKVDRWRPSLFMRRWMSRITLEITGVRVERVRDITEEDAIAEGVERFEFIHVGKYMASDWRHYGDDKTGCANARESFLTLWRSINGPTSLAGDPWVWVIEFKRIDGEES